MISSIGRGDFHDRLVYESRQERGLGWVVQDQLRNKYVNAYDRPSDAEQRLMRLGRYYLCALS